MIKKKINCGKSKRIRLQIKVRLFLIFTLFCDRRHARFPLFCVCNHSSAFLYQMVQCQRKREERSEYRWDIKIKSLKMGLNFKVGSLLVSGSSFGRKFHLNGNYLELWLLSLMLLPVKSHGRFFFYSVSQDAKI